MLGGSDDKNFINKPSVAMHKVEDRSIKPIFFYIFPRKSRYTSYGEFFTRRPVMEPPRDDGFKEEKRLRRDN